MQTVSVNQSQFEYEWIAPQRSALPPLAFLHEALGCVALWRGFPARVAQATGCGALTWSRLGHGASSPNTTRRTVSYLHHEAQRCMPALLAALGVERPVLIGHSDGATIALLYAATFPNSVSGIVVLAPHAFVEEEALAGIRSAGIEYANSDWPRRLACYHRHPDELFRAWHDTWLSPAFRGWDIRDCLPAIRCRILAIQGEGDEYATMRQIECIGEACADATLVKLPDCRHSPHRDQPQAVIDAVLGFVSSMSLGKGGDEARPTRAGGAVPYHLVG